MENNINRVNRPIQPGGQVPTPQPVQGGQQPTKKSKKISTGLIVKIVAVAVVTIAVLALVFVFVYSNTKGISSDIQKDKYQAVFLNSADGQVYFGKFSVLNNDYYKLEDIFYVRVEQVQPNPNEKATQNISLAKLGSEIHGPQDVMYIRKDHVMFWENLKDDGQVVKAITEYKANGNKTPAPAENNSTTNPPANQ